MTKNKLLITWYSYNVFVAHRTSFFIIQPFVQTCGMVFMPTPFQLLDLLSSLKVIKTNGATLFFSIMLCIVNLFRYLSFLLCSQSFAHFTIILFKFQQLFVCHVIWINYIRIIFTFFNSSLEKSFFFCLSTLLSKHTVHHYLHHNFFFSLSCFLMLKMKSEKFCMVFISWRSILLTLIISFSFSLFIFFLLSSLDFP